MVKKIKISPEDLATFQKAVSGTKPLSHNKIRLKTRATVANKATKQKAPPNWIEENLQDVPDVQGEEFIAYKQTGVANKTLRNLRKGQYNVEAILDLHGLSVDAAKTAVNSFLQQCLNEKIRVALIIHGKGHHSEMPILKNKLNHWLREVNIVLAFCSAAPSHGSRGAIYILLKHKAEENLFE